MAGIGDQDKQSIQPPRTVDLGSVSAEFKLERTLRDRVADEVLTLFRWSLLGTLASALFILLIDEAYLFYKIITPEQRLMTEKVLMTLIGATVVQVGAALAAIVFAVFKSDGRPNDDGGEAGN